MLHRKRDTSATSSNGAVLIVLASVLAACATGEGARSAAHAPPAGNVPSSAPVDTTQAVEALPFVHDDYARALAESKRTKRPIFVDAWAPWCHSCQSMRAYVLTDRSLAPLASDFVWLTIDTEKESNASFVERFPNRVWPTLWVIDGEREAATLRWEGTATAPELLTLLATVRDGRRAGAAEATMTFLRANQAASRGDVAGAERGYREVIAHEDVPERARAVEALVELLSAKKDHRACADLAIAESRTLPPGTSRATLLATGLSCARDGKRDADTSVLAAAAERAATDPDPHTIADDRSALFEQLVETKKEQGDEAGGEGHRAHLGVVPRARGLASADQAGEGGVRCAPSVGLPRRGRNGACDPDAPRERARFPRRLQSAGAARARVSHAEALRRGTGGRRSRERPRLRAAVAARLRARGRHREGAR